MNDQVLRTVSLTAAAALALSACMTVIPLANEGNGGGDDAESDAGAADAAPDAAPDAELDADAPDAGESPDAVDVSDAAEDSGLDAGDDGAPVDAADTTPDAALDTAPVDLPEWVTTSGWTESACADVAIDLTAGRRSYQLFCQSCHGVEGVGSTLGPIVRFPAVDFALYVTRNGRNDQGYPGPMMAYTADMLPAEDVCSVLAYLRSFDEPATGQEMYNTFCGSCHGVDGQGGRTGKEIAGQTGSVTEATREGKGRTSYGSRTAYMPHWASDELSTAELNLLMDYINGL